MREKFKSFCLGTRSSSAERRGSVYALRAFLFGIAFLWMFAVAVLVLVGYFQSLAWVTLPLILDAAFCVFAPVLATKFVDQRRLRYPTRYQHRGEFG